MFGPGFDNYENIYNESRHDVAKGSGSALGFTMGEVGGQISMAIGGTTVDSTTGAFSIQLTHLVAAAPPAMARPWSLAGLGSMTRQPTPHKKD